MTANSLHHSVSLGTEMGSCSLNTEFNSTSIIKCLLYARVCERGAKRDWSMPLGSWNLKKWMNDRMVLCRSTTMTQMEDWEEDQGRLRQQVTFHMPLVSTTEVRRCYFKWQPLSKVGGRNLEKPSILFGRRQWQPTPVLLPGKSHGRRSLVGYNPWGRWARHDWATSLSLFTFMHWRRKWQPTPVFLPGESQGRWSLVGCCLWGLTESDKIEVT